MKYFLMFCIWQMEWEHRVGFHTGMNPVYLAKLRADITNMEGDLLKYQVATGETK